MTVRNGYLDLLRALAIGRVVVYHATGLAPLTVIFPAMGVMFAVGGSLMAASLERSGPVAVLHRLRRTLPPLWTIAVFAVPAMLLSGLLPDWRVLLWALPLLDPPATDWGHAVLGVVWYLRQYLWFVLLSPLALPVFRRFPLAALVVPPALLAAIEFGVGGLGPLRDFGIYGGCWLLGFAHHDGMLRRLSGRFIIVSVAVLGSVGLAWLVTHPGVQPLNFNLSPVAHALWSLAFVLALLARAPRTLGWLEASAIGSAVVRAVSHRSATVYLWHQSVIVGLGIVAGTLGFGLDTAFSRTVWLGTVVLGVLVCVAAFGWIEDLAARRPPVLVPKLRAAAGEAPAT